MTGTVLHVVESLETGGLERIVVDLARAQLASGFRPKVACIYKTGRLALELEEMGVEVIALDKSQGFDLRVVFRLAKVARQNALLIHAHNHIPHLYASLAGLFSRRPVISTRHGMGGNPLLRRERLFRLVLPIVSAVVCVCEAAAQSEQLAQVRKRFPRKLKVVPNGTRLEEYLAIEHADRNKTLDELGISPAQTIFGSVGRLNKMKNHELMIRAFANAAEHIGESHLIVVGEGATRPEIETLIRELNIGDRVTLLGERTDVAAILPAMDIFLLSSNSEGYSVALLEACASGIPVIATDVGGNSEIIAHGERGLVVPPGSVDAFGAAMTDLANDEATRRVMGSKAREWAANHGTLSTMADRYRAIYSDVTGTPC